MLKPFKSTLITAILEVIDEIALKFELEKSSEGRDPEESMGKSSIETLWFML